MKATNMALIYSDNIAMLCFSIEFNGFALLDKKTGIVRHTCNCYNS